MENEIREEEANIKLKQSDMKNLENEIETMNQMIKQLDTQKDVARKKLDEMAAQVRCLKFSSLTNFKYFRTKVAFHFACSIFI